MKIPFFSFAERNQKLKAETLAVFEEFYDSNWYVLGKFTQKFEKEFADYNQVKHAVGVSTGLDALHLSLLALGVGDGDEVVVPSNTYIATVLAISFVGATPIFVEPRLETANLNPELLEAAITEKTKAIMPVHLYGQACEMDAIMEIANRHNLFVVEDNAQAHGARYNGKLTGSFGQANATSFYPTKNIGALGEAGAVTTDDPEIAEKISVFRNYGSQKRYYNNVVGYNMRIDEFEAAFLGICLKHIESWTKEREEMFKLYSECLAGIEGISPLKIAEGATTVNHLYTIRTQRRDELQAFLNEKGIGTKIHYPVPPHLQECYKNLGYSKGDFPIAEEIAETTLSLPNFIGIKESEIHYVGECIKSFFKES